MVTHLTGNGLEVRQTADLVDGLHLVLHAVQRRVQLLVDVTTQALQQPKARR